MNKAKRVAMCLAALVMPVSCSNPFDQFAYVTLPPGYILLVPDKPCPSKRTYSSSNRGRGLKATLVPEGATELRICRYYSLQSGQRGYVDSGKITNKHAIQSLTKVLNSFPQTSGYSTTSCFGVNHGDVVVAVFGYESS